MLDYLSCVGFCFPKEIDAFFFKEYVQMLETYEAKSSKKITARGQEYLILQTDPLELSFTVDENGDSPSEEVQLFYPTQRWQTVTEARWLPEAGEEHIAVANAMSAYGISLNICVPLVYADPLEPDRDYQLQFACFAAECSVCSEEEYGRIGTTLAPMSFLNIGSYRQDASCAVNGKLTAIQVCENEYSGCEYYHFTAQCQDLVLDILADKATVTGEPHIGDIITVEGWLTGKFRHAVS